jgi:hypothetical protein
MKFITVHPENCVRSVFNNYQPLLLIYIIETGGNSGRECKVGAGVGCTAPKTAGLKTRF